MNLDRWRSQNTNIFLSHVTTWQYNFSQVFIPVTIRRDTSFLTLLADNSKSTGDTGRKPFPFHSALFYWWFISVLCSLLEVLSKSCWARSFLQTCSCNFPFLYVFQQAATTVGRRPFGQMGTQQVLVPVWLKKLGMGMPQRTEKKNKSLFHLWISNLSSKQLKIQVVFFVKHSGRHMCLGQKVDLAAASPGSIRKKVAGSAKHNPLPTLKARQKLRSFLGCFGGDCYLLSTNRQLCMFLAFNGLFPAGSQGVYLFTFPKL